MVVTAGKCLQNRPFVRFFCICELTNLLIEFFGEILSTCQELTLVYGYNLNFWFWNFFGTSLIRQTQQKNRFFSNKASFSENCLQLISNPPLGPPKPIYCRNYMTILCHIQIFSPWRVKPTKLLSLKHDRVMKNFEQKQY